MFLKFLKGIENEIIKWNVKNEVVARQIHYIMAQKRISKKIKLISFIHLDFLGAT